jgi:hypothetical protein
VLTFEFSALPVQILHESQSGAISELLAHRALLDCSLRSLRCSLGCRHLRRSRLNGKALFRPLLLQIGGANIADPPPSSSLVEERTPLLTPPPHSSPLGLVLTSLAQFVLARRRAISDARSNFRAQLGLRTSATTMPATSATKPASPRASSVPLWLCQEFAWLSGTSPSAAGPSPGVGVGLASLGTGME